MKKNPGHPLDMDWIETCQVEENEIAARLSSLEDSTPGRTEDRAEWLIRAVRCVDLTTLSGDDTPTRVRNLCRDARMPIGTENLKALGILDQRLSTAAVCVYHRMLESALEALEGSGIPVATVSAGFPHGLSPLSVRLAEIEASVAAGALEIDTVIPRFLALEGQWDRLYEEVSAYRRSCGEAHLKVILSTGELGTLENVWKTSMVCMMAGADFIKTSTGKEKVNATLPVGLVMARAIREYHQRVGHQVGLKPAGGIQHADEAMAWFGLAQDVLGPAWTEPALFRFGASSLLGSLRRELEQLAL